MNKLVHIRKEYTRKEYVQVDPDTYCDELNLLEERLYQMSWWELVKRHKGKIVGASAVTGGVLAWMHYKHQEEEKERERMQSYQQDGLQVTTLSVYLIPSSKNTTKTLFAPGSPLLRLRR